METFLLRPMAYWGHQTVMLPGTWTSPTYIPSGGVCRGTAVGTEGYRRMASYMTAFRWSRVASAWAGTSTVGEGMWGASSWRSWWMCWGWRARRSMMWVREDAVVSLGGGGVSWV